MENAGPAALSLPDSTTATPSCVATFDKQLQRVQNNLARVVYKMGQNVNARSLIVRSCIFSRPDEIPRMAARLRDLITGANFGDRRLMGFVVKMGQMSCFPQ